MVNNFRSAIVLLTSFFLLVGCSTYEDLKIGAIRNVDLKGVDNNILDVEITVPVENPNAFSVKMMDADFVVSNGETVIGKMKQVDEVVIKARSKNDYPLHVRVELTNVNLNILSIYSLFQQRANMKLSGTVVVRSSLYRKKIEIKDYQLLN